MNKTLKRKCMKNNDRKNKKTKVKRFSHRRKKYRSRKQRLITGGVVIPATIQPDIASNLGDKYYQYNNNIGTGGDPTNPSGIMEARNISLKGGKKHRKKMKGGNFFLTSSLLNNPFTNFASFTGAYTGASLISGNQTYVNPDPTVQPAYYTYNGDRTPLA